MYVANGIYKCNEVTNNIFQRNLVDVIGLLHIVITFILKRTAVALLYFGLKRNLNVSKKKYHFLL